MNNANRALLEDFLASGALEVPDMFQFDKVFNRRFRIRLRQFRRQFTGNLIKTELELLSAAAQNIEIDVDLFNEKIRQYEQHVTGSPVEEQTKSNSIEALIDRWRELYGGLLSSDGD